MKINTNGIKTTEYSKHFFTVIMPCFNGGQFLAHSIKSVLTQTFSNFELIIINDGSTDNSLKVIESFANQDDRIRIISHKPNRGASATRNKGLDQARGRFVAFIDCDDWWPEEKLATYADKHKEGHDLVFSSYDIVSYPSNKIIKRIKVPLKLSYTDLKYSNQIPLSSASFNFTKISNKRFKDSQNAEDWIFWLHNIKYLINPIGIQTRLMFYRRHDKNKSKNKLKMLKKTWNIFRIIHGWSIVHSSYAIFRYLYNKCRRYYL
jgi:teichuronic acid biosynthesis glycosyltransferase TuaG